jgi:hypothetical protein
VRRPEPTRVDGPVETTTVGASSDTVTRLDGYGERRSNRIEPVEEEIFGSSLDEVLRAPAADNAGRAARTVHLGTGNGLVTDDPYAETKDLLVGYSLVETETIDEAIEHAKRIPGFVKWAVGVRPVVDFRSR